MSGGAGTRRLAAACVWQIGAWRVRSADRGWRNARAAWSRVGAWCAVPPGWPTSSGISKSRGRAAGSSTRPPALVQPDPRSAGEDTSGLVDPCSRNTWRAGHPSRGDVVRAPQQGHCLTRGIKYLAGRVLTRWSLPGPSLPVVARPGGPVRRLGSGPIRGTSWSRFAGGRPARRTRPRSCLCVCRARP